MMPMEIDWKVVTEAGESGGYVRLDTDEDAKKLWSALPPDLRLALAKTCPKVAGPWESWGRLWRRRCPSTLNDLVSGEEHQRPELDFLLLERGYVLDGDTQ